MRNKEHEHTKERGNVDRRLVIWTHEVYIVSTFGQVIGLKPPARGFCRFLLHQSSVYPFLSATCDEMVFCTRMNERVTYRPAVRNYHSQSSILSGIEPTSLYHLLGQPNPALPSFFTSSKLRCKSIQEKKITPEI